MLCQDIHKCQRSCPYFNLFLPLFLLSQATHQHSSSSPSLQLTTVSSRDSLAASAAATRHREPLQPFSSWVTPHRTNKRGGEKQPSYRRKCPLLPALARLSWPHCWMFPPSLWLHLQLHPLFEGVKNTGVTEHDLSRWPGKGSLRGTSWVPTHYQNCSSILCILGLRAVSWSHWGWPEQDETLYSFCSGTSLGSLDQQIHTHPFPSAYIEDKYIFLHSYWIWNHLKKLKTHKSSYFSLFLHKIGSLLFDKVSQTWGFFHTAVLVETVGGTS